MKRKTVRTEQVWGQYDTITKRMSWLGQVGASKKDMASLWAGEVWVRITLTYEVPK